MSDGGLAESYGLPRVIVDGSGAAGVAELEIGAHLGAGGYALVREGRQHALSRHVAVKTLPNFDDDPEAYDALVREARVLGALDHSSIVPVHLLGSDIDGAPLLVMPLIKGVPWTELIDRHDHPFWDQHTGEKRTASSRMDRLTSHLGILMKVANAVQHAHERGVIHCDIKPDNVMVGEFGQVFLIDWGLAMRIAQCGPDVLDWGADIDSAAGSPNYMAPEMAFVDELTAQSDVYLLGGCLHEVLTGDVPHHGRSMVETVSRIREVSSFEYDSSLPPRLVAAAQRALRFDKSGRFDSARSFRAAIVEYLDCRFGDAWLAEAEGRIDELANAVMSSVGLDASPAEEASQGPRSEPSVLAPSAPEPWRVHELYAASWYGLQQAKQHGADTPRVDEGLRRSAELMVKYSLDHGDLGLAEQLLSDSRVAETRPELVYRLRLLRRRERRKSSIRMAAVGGAGEAQGGQLFVRRASSMAGGFTVLCLLVLSAISADLGFAAIGLAAGLGFPYLLGASQRELGDGGTNDVTGARRRAAWHAVPYVVALALAGALPSGLFDESALPVIMAGVLTVYLTVSSLRHHAAPLWLATAGLAACTIVSGLLPGVASLIGAGVFGCTTLGSWAVDRLDTP